MSKINLIIINGKKITFSQDHYREVSKILNNTIKQKTSILDNYLDSGYILIDINRKLIISSQDCINIKKKGFDVFRV